MYFLYLFLGKETNLSTYISKKMYSETLVEIFNLLNYKREYNLIVKILLYRAQFDNINYKQSIF